LLLLVWNIARSLKNPITESYKFVMLLGLLRALLGLYLWLKYRLSLFGNELFRNICRCPRKLHIEMCHNFYLSADSIKVNKSLMNWSDGTCEIANSRKMLVWKHQRKKSIDITVEGAAVVWVVYICVERTDASQERLHSSLKEIN